MAERIPSHSGRPEPANSTIVKNQCQCPMLCHCGSAEIILNIFVIGLSNVLMSTISIFHLVDMKYTQAVFGHQKNTKTAFTIG